MPTPTTVGPEPQTPFSDLEVVHTSASESYKYRLSQHSSDPEALDPHCLPEAIPKEIPPSDSKSDTLPSSDEQMVAPGNKRRRLICIGVILVLIIVIVGSAVGGVLGSRRSKDAGENSPVDTAEKPLPRDENVKVLNTSRLSAVDWTNGDDGGVNYRAVFWQATTQDLMASIWDSGSGNWSIPLNLTLNGAIDASEAKNGFRRPKPGTPLAATVRLHPWPKPVAIALFYVSEENTIEELITYQISAKQDWKVCCLSNTATKAIVAPDTELAAFTASCNGAQCKNDWIWVSYQIPSGAIQQVSQKDWGKRRIITYPIRQNGTGLTMTSTGSRSSNDTNVFSPRLYLQDSTDVQQKLWFPDSGDRTKVESARTDADGNPLQLSSAIVPSIGDAKLPSNDVLLLSIASDGSQLLINRCRNQSESWTGGLKPDMHGTPPLNFTAGTLVAAPDQARFLGLDSNGTIQSFKINQGTTATDWDYEGIIFESGS